MSAKRGDFVHANIYFMITALKSAEASCTNPVKLHRRIHFGIPRVDGCANVVPEGQLSEKP